MIVSVLETGLAVVALIWAYPVGHLGDAPLTVLTRFPFLHEIVTTLGTTFVGVVGTGVGLTTGAGGVGVGLGVAVVIEVNG